MTTAKSHFLTAEHALRIALGAFFNAEARRPADAPALIGEWMLEITRKLASDRLTCADYRTVIARWEAEENPDFAAQELNALHPEDNRHHNAAKAGSA